MNETTSSTAGDLTGYKCGYCGMWHNYSAEMCRDMLKRPVPFVPFKEYCDDYVRMDTKVTRSLKCFDELKYYRILELLREVIEVAERQAEARKCGLEHAPWCNFPGDLSTFCNCGLRNLQILAEKVKGLNL